MTQRKSSSILLSGHEARILVPDVHKCFIRIWLGRHVRSDRLVARYGALGCITREVVHDLREPAAGHGRSRYGRLRSAIAPDVPHLGLLVCLQHFELAAHASISAGVGNLIARRALLYSLTDARRIAVREVVVVALHEIRLSAVTLLAPLKTRSLWLF